MANLQTLLGAPPRRKCFISYHHADERAVADFVSIFDHQHDVFIRRRLGENPEDLIDSTDTDYVMSQIRRRFLHDSTVTIVMMGRCTWSRRYIDWEIQSSLRRGATLPNGLLGVKLSTFSNTTPPRFNSNLSSNWPAVDCYARHIEYPRTLEDLQRAIEAAYQRRTTYADLIVNPRDRMRNNRTCP